MSGDDTKEVKDALQAIKKLVEMSEEQMSASDDVVMLDNVVWRNPVSDEAEDLDQDEQGKAPKGKAGEVQIASMRRPADMADRAAHAQDEAEPPKALDAPSHYHSASISISPRDLDEFAAKPVVAQAPEVQSAQTQNAPRHQPTTPIAPTTSPLPQAQMKDTPQPEVEDDITELTSPLGRRGGGFYDSSLAPALRARPAIKTSVTQNEPPLTIARSAVTSSPVSQTEAPVAKTTDAPRPAIKTSPVPVEPAITDFHGADFNFSAAEGLMTAASFSDLADQQAVPITPEVNVPIAQPAVSDPASEAQSLFEEAQAPHDDSFEADEAMPAYPNLHIVSDQGAIGDGATEDEEEGFSGAVRMALRSIIKEQVSTWLQGNMTGLIEEALTTPQKRPSSGAKSGKKKR